MSQTIGICPLCGEGELLEHTAITAEEMAQPEMRLTDVACKNEGCKNLHLERPRRGGVGA